MARSKKAKAQPQPPQAEAQPAAPATPAPSQEAASPAPPPQEQPVTQQAPAESQEEAPQLMQKGIYLSVLVYIEGMQAPADDFAALAKDALTDALSGEHKGLRITLKNSHVENNVEDTEDSGESSSKKGGFEF